MSASKPTNAGAPLLTYPRLRVKLDSLSIEAYALINKVWLFCQDAGNGGRFHVDELPAATSRLLTPNRLKKALAEVARHQIDHRDGTSSPLWLSIDDDHIQMPEWWIELNPGAEVWQDDVLRWRRSRNKELHSPKCNELREKIRRRDRNLCRYCGRRVKWGANNANHGATYDHVDPDEGNTFDTRTKQGNVVVACRRCNGRKKDRTPDQWIEDDPGQGMSLLPAGTTADQAAVVREARAGPNPGSTQAEPESDLSSRPRARPSRVEPGSNPNRAAIGSVSTRPTAHRSAVAEPDVPPPPDDQQFTGGSA